MPSTRPFGKLRFRANRDLFLGDFIDLRFAVVDKQQGGFGEIYIPEITFKKMPPADVGLDRDPNLSLEQEAAQELMDELWRVGIRPTDGAGSAGAMAATVRHLEDMRHLVFNTAPKTDVKVVKHTADGGK